MDIPDYVMGTSCSMSWQSMLEGISNKPWIHLAEFGRGLELRQQIPIISSSTAWMKITTFQLSKIFNLQFHTSEILIFKLKITTSEILWQGHANIRI